MSKQSTSPVPLGEIAALGHIPVWLDLDAGHSAPRTYDSLFQEQQGRTQSLLYAAGDYGSAATGFLKLDESRTDFRVDVATDVPTVQAGREEASEELIRSRFSTLYLQDMRDETIAALAERFARPQEAGLKPFEELAVFGMNHPGDARETGYGHGLLHLDEHLRPRLDLRYTRILSPDDSAGPERLLRVVARSVADEIEIGAMLDHFQYLANRYRDMGRDT